MSTFVQHQTRQELPPEEISPYGYVPTQWICVLFLILFSLSTLIHGGQGLRYKTWFIFPTIFLGGIGEIMGWAGRLWSSNNVSHRTPFMIQICTTVFSPTFVIAANFIIFGRIVGILGSSYSRLRPGLYAIVFLCGDIFSFLIQGVGGGIAASAETHDKIMRGSHIMLAGIAFQLVVLVIYILLSTEFYYRHFNNKPFTNRAGEAEILRGEFDSHMRWMVWALSFSSLVLFIRAIYRTIELEDGWDGRIITTELYFNVLDGAMIVLAMWTFNFFHPGALLSGKHIAQPMGFALSNASASATELMVRK
ncbi:hypothetical protein AX16_001140 [Volvariella volvacea WC 439]|nr:hypothetical protein AX16_001140 [Volvariella volvacea WC 439]